MVLHLISNIFYLQNRIEQLLAQNQDLLATIRKLMDQVKSSTSGKEIFDPIDETWMMSSFPLTDSYFSRISQSVPIENKVTNECISNVFDNIHHQSLRQGSGEGSLMNSTSQLTHEDGQQEGAHEKSREVPLQFISEKNGGISRSFTDLTKIGLEDRRMDLNHNANRITKFENREEESVRKETKERENLNIINEKSALSKEMMETFSEELNELEEKRDEQIPSVTEL